MITPSQLKDHEFRPAGRNAYKAEDVDAFFAELRADYERLFRENGEISKRANSLAETLERYRRDDGEIKKAVIAAQRASELITKEAEATARDIVAEAEAVLAAAKSEAQIIRDDAAKQAAADSELLMSVTREKVQQIIVKAKKEAEEIVAQARDCAGDQIGVATRTVTSETIFYDMLKKEVAEFKASILAQYKTHIELIQRLPEVAVDEALRADGAEPDAAQIPAPSYEEEAAAKADEIIGSVVSQGELPFTADDEPIDEAVVSIDADSDDYTDTVELTIGGDDSADGELSFVSVPFDGDEVQPVDGDTSAEQIEFTTLPYSFGGDSDIEFIDDSDDVIKTADIPISADTAEIEIAAPADSASADDESVAAPLGDNYDFASLDTDSVPADDASDDSSDDSSDGDSSGEPKDIPISRPAAVNREAEEQTHQDDTTPSAPPAEHRKKVTFFKKKKNNGNNG